MKLNLASVVGLSLIMLSSPMISADEDVPSLRLTVGDLSQAADHLNRWEVSPAHGALERAEWRLEMWRLEEAQRRGDLRGDMEVDRIWVGVRSLRIRVEPHLRSYPVRDRFAVTELVRESRSLAEQLTRTRAAVEEAATGRSLRVARDALIRAQELLMVQRQEGAARVYLTSASLTLGDYPYDGWVASAHASTQWAIQALSDRSLGETARIHRAVEFIRSAVSAIERSVSYQGELRRTPVPQPRPVPRPIPRPIPRPTPTPAPEPRWTMSCRSVGDFRQECSVPGTIRSVESVLPHRGSQACLRGLSWDVSWGRRSIWVDRGCSAEFHLTLER